MVKKLLKLLFVLCFSIIPLFAQAAGIIYSGDAVVTGFSGLIKPGTPGAFFDLNGPSVRIINLPGSGSYGLVDVAKHFTVYAKDVGQVFGVTLDNQVAPNIYVAATSAYGLAIQQSNGDRLQQGAPDAQYMPGQFGPSQVNGGPTSIWRIDGKTGKVTLFANVEYNGIQNTPASLGGLTFDSKSQQLFVADRATGMIHRFTMDGVDQGIYDHGSQGLVMIGAAALPFDASTLADIHNPNFDTQNPSTWGYAPMQRRVFALAMRNDRLFYSANGAEIWSVGINADGTFAEDARLEVEVPQLRPDTEISAITFDKRGLMYTAERAAATGDADFINLAYTGQTRVKRFTPRKPTADNPALWSTPGEEYAIGSLADYQNADGGTALTCGRTLWSTADHLTTIDGIQGNDVDLIKPANTPPVKSWLINYYDTEADPNSRGHIGSMVIWNDCGSATYILPSIPPQFKCPTGTFLVDGACLIPPTCPEGTIFQNGTCLWPDCPWGYIRSNNICVQPPRSCDYGYIFYNGNCVPVGCPPPLVRTRSGYCHCPYNTYYEKGRCVPPPACPYNQRYIDGRCVPPPICPYGQVYINGWCVPPPLCPYNQRYVNGRCVPPPICPKNQKYYNGRCIPICPYNQQYINGHCAPPPLCPNNKVYINGRCVNPPVCRPGQVYTNGHCAPPPLCPDNKIYVNGKCINPPVCRSGQVYRNGQCSPPPLCPDNKVYINGQCVTRPINKQCPPGQQMLNGQCVPLVKQPCPEGQRRVNGQCKRTIIKHCPSGQRMLNGQCTPILRSPNLNPQQKQMLQQWQQQKKIQPQYQQPKLNIKTQPTNTQSLQQQQQQFKNRSQTHKQQLSPTQQQELQQKKEELKQRIQKKVDEQSAS